MDFDLSDDQRLLRESLDRLLVDTYDFDRRRAIIASPEGWSRESWQRFAEMGLLALPFAEADGGIGGGPVETMLVMEAIGRSLVLEPYLASIVLAGGILRHAAHGELVPAIASGSEIIAFAQAEAHSRYDLGAVATSARREGSGWVLNGEKRHVLHGGAASRLIVSARTGSGIGLFLIDADAPGTTIRAYPTQDRQRAAQITLTGVYGEQIADDALPLIERAVDETIAALCAEAVGAMERAFELTLDHLRLREQFGKPIGSFQALQHRAVDMLVKLEEARGMSYYATMMCADPDPLERRRAVSMAKVQIGRSGRFIGEQAVQLHGGIGMTDEHAIGHYYRRLTVIDMLFGDATHHLGLLAA